MDHNERTRRFFAGKFVIITGGSKGIGLATAEQVFALGADLAIVARDAAGLTAARASVERGRVHPDQLLETISCDCTDQAALKPLLETLVVRRGSPDCLINCVGYAGPGYAQDLDLAAYRRHMEVNFFGQLVPILILMPHLLAARRGHIANVSSLLGFMGAMGYAAYCPSKFAITGLTEALRNELGVHGLSFSIVFPADVDTPGYAEENRTKPPECKEISKRARILSPEAVARAMIRGIARGQFEIAPGEAATVRKCFRFVPWLVRWIIDHDYREARRLVASSS